LNEDYQARVRSIADSIKANGFYADKPLAGYVGKDESTGDGVIFLTDGHTRLAAYDLAVNEGANIEVLPMVTKPAGTTMEDLTVAIVRGNQGTPLSPYELALGCKRLIDYGLDEDQIVHRLGLGKKYVSDLLLLMSAPAKVRGMVESGKISASVAISALRAHGSKVLKVLEKSIEKAQTDGKDRVLPKHVRAASGTGVRVAKPIILRSMDYLKQNKLDGDERFMRFMAFLSGMDSADEFKSFIDAAQKRAEKKAEVKTKDKAGKKGGNAADAGQADDQGASTPPES
jgi:ParB-like chromosome segregation protein Spo0J